MGKNKLKRFEELGNMERVFQPPFDDIFRQSFYLKGKWAQKVFNNHHPVILELGCGKGEYTIGLAREYPEKNFLGVDIKGARIWKGAKISNEENLVNSAFLRTRIELIDSFFAKNEIEEIWLTFPDPQEKKRRAKKRLSGPVYLNMYRKFLVNNGVIHLKTDNSQLYNYTLELARYNDLDILNNTDDLYKSDVDDKILRIQTFYEKQFLSKGMNIHYLRFTLPAHNEIIELPEKNEK